MATASNCLYIHCDVPVDIALTRMTERTGRHWVHQDLSRLDELRNDIAAGHYDPLTISVAPVVIDTSRPSSVQLAIDALQAGTKR